MTTVSTLGVDQLSLRGSGTDYNILSRFFATKAQADAALADSSWVPTAGKTNGCITGDQGILVYDFGTSALVVADAATRSYVDTEVAAAVAALVNSSPQTLDTLSELAAAINDDANFATTITNSIAAVQADVDQNESDADAAIAAVRYVPKGHSAQAMSSTGPPGYTTVRPGGQLMLWGVHDIFPPRENVPPGQSMQLELESCACPGGQAGSDIQWHFASVSLRANLPRGHVLQRWSMLAFPR